MDFYSSRLTQRERGPSLTQELMSDKGLAAARKRRFTKLQAEATKFQKVKRRKTDMPRNAPKKKRVKH